MQRGVDHVVLERDRVLHNWRDARWDAFSLVTPNWQCALPGHPYPGDDPDGFMVKDEILAYVEPYAHGKPIYEGVTVHAVRPGFEVETSHGTLTADQVVLAVGGYHVPFIPDHGLPGIHSSRYRNPESLPDGPVLVVGTGQSGAQIAEDLHLAGRTVHLAVGTAPRVARFYRGRDCVAWLQDMGHYDLPVTEHPQGKATRKEANHYVTGRNGGHDLDLRAFAAEGLHLHGRLTHVEDGTLHFAGDLPANLDAADATMERIKDGIDRYIAANGIEAPEEPRYTPRLDAADRRLRHARRRSVQHDRLGDRLPQRLVLRARSRRLRRGRLPGAPPRRHAGRRPVLRRPAVAAHLGLGSLRGDRARRRVPGRRDRLPPRRRRGLVARLDDRADDDEDDQRDDQRVLDPQRPVEPLEPVGQVDSEHARIVG